LANFATGIAGVVDTGGKFFTVVNDWRQISVFLIEDFFHLPPGSTTPAVHLELQIYPQIFEQI
jgi:hypothetical protein